MKLNPVIGGVVAAAVACGVAFGAAHSAKVVKKASSSKGEILVNGKGMSLYTFKKDKPGDSNCNGKCAMNWPPVKAKVAGMKEGKFSVIKRDDGSLQWAHNGMPLYTWIKDKKPGDVTGDGFKGAWKLARP